MTWLKLKLLTCMSQASCSWGQKLCNIPFIFICSFYYILNILVDTFVNLIFLVGWVTIPLYRVPGDDPLDDEEELNRIENEEDEEGKDDDDKNPQNKKKPIRTHFVQICVVSMHQNGRDAHIRQVKMFGPRRGGELAVQQCNDSSWDCGVPKFQTVEMSQFSTIR